MRSDRKASEDELAQINHLQTLKAVLVLQNWARRFKERKQKELLGSCPPTMTTAETAPPLKDADALIQPNAATTDAPAPSTRDVSDNRLAGKVSDDRPSGRRRSPKISPHSSIGSPGSSRSPEHSVGSSTSGPIVACGHRRLRRTPTQKQNQPCSPEGHSENISEEASHKQARTAGRAAECSSKRQHETHRSSRQAASPAAESSMRRRRTEQRHHHRSSEQLCPVTPSRHESRQRPSPHQHSAPNQTSWNQSSCQRIQAVDAGCRGSQLEEVQQQRGSAQHHTSEKLSAPWQSLSRMSGAVPRGSRMAMRRSPADSRHHNRPNPREEQENWIAQDRASPQPDLKNSNSKFQPIRACKSGVGIAISRTTSFARSASTVRQHVPDFFKFMGKDAGRKSSPATPIATNAPAAVVSTEESRKRGSARRRRHRDINVAGACYSSSNEQHDANV